MVIFLAVMSLLLITLSYLANNDLLSPSKFYLVSLSLYFFDIYIHDQNDFVYFIYLLFLLVGFIFIVIEKKVLKNKFISRKNNYKVFFNENVILIILWTISLVPILAQIYMVYLMGGLVEYAVSVKLRVAVWSGLGPVLALKLIFPIVNIIYFMFGILFEIRNKKVWWGLFFVHVGIMISLGLLSGSRGATLLGLTYLAIVYNYYVKPVPVSMLMVLFVGLLVGTAFLGSARGSFQYSQENGLEVNADLSKLTKASFIKYGIIPLDCILDDEYTDYKYGATFASVLTNFIPRSLWKDKFETGGVVLTKFKKKGQYTGTTNYSTGILVESIINYGYFFGVIFAFLVLFVFIFISIKFYIKMLMVSTNTPRIILNIKYAFFYLLFFSIPANLLMAEFTNTLMNLLLNLVLFSAIYYILVRNIRVIAR